jgi:hypothetical protein
MSWLVCFFFWKFSLLRRVEIWKEECLLYAEVNTLSIQMIRNEKKEARKEMNFLLHLVKLHTENTETSFAISQNLALYLSSSSLDDRYQMWEVMFFVTAH